MSVQIGVRRDVDEAVAGDSAARHSGTSDHGPADQWKRQTRLTAGVHGRRLGGRGAGQTVGDATR